jgi:signal transduction histidine kinase
MPVNSQTFSSSLLLGGSILTLAAFLLLFFLREKTIRGLRSSLNKMTSSFRELDEQAKLIVQTDLELNKAQEALDRRLNGLDALQKISRLISTTLDEDEIFRRLNQPLLTELGFEKYLILSQDHQGKFVPRVDFGFPAHETQALTQQLNESPSLLKALTQGQLVSSLKTPADIKEHFVKTFHLKHFVLTPILSQEQMLGFILAGNQSDAFIVTEGDEEVISILSGQISHALENARLFEQVYRSSQELEVKVQQRTKELTVALEKVRQISQMKSEFISAVSHELRTPLTSIKGYASLLIAGKVGEIPGGVKERLEKINKHSDNLVQMINNLLDIARIESGRTEMKFLRHDVPSIVDSVYDLLTPQLKEKNIRFIADVAPNSPEVLMDSTQIERVFINLIGNAIKFTPEQGTITVKVTHDETKVMASVSDSGIGIKEDDLSKLFKEFYRIDNPINQNIKGTGLGLALAKKIVMAHNGEISVTSQVNHGTTFSFSLPLRPPTEPEQKTEPT